MKEKLINYIELDCPPGGIRPGHLIGEVIEGLGLEEKKPCLMLFGNWVWDYSEVPKERWEAIRPILKKRIGKLYHEGFIRYGSW